MLSILIYTIPLTTWRGRKFQTAERGIDRFEYLEGEFYQAAEAAHFRWLVSLGEGEDADEVDHPPSVRRAPAFFIWTSTSVGAKERKNFLPVSCTGDFGEYTRLLANGGKVFHHESVFANSDVSSSAVLGASFFSERFQQSRSY